MNTLHLTLILLGASVLAVILFRRINLPPVLGYLFVGSLIGPHAFNFMKDVSAAQSLAEFGVVFLMFSIGLEFSLPRLYAMKRTVFGLGGLQVAGTMLAIMLLALLCGLSWQTGIALGGVLAMSSTAVLSKLLSERMELSTPHGRDIIGVLLFQDLAVVPLLILLPSLSQPPEKMTLLIGLALGKAVVLLSVILFFGQRVMKSWFHIVARARSPEIFVLNVLLITLLLAWMTEEAGLSLALGAFVAGMLISETEYKLTVEEDIKPFRDVLMGLFFVTIGMRLDIPILLQNWWAVFFVLSALLALKGAVVFLAARRMGSTPGNSARSALWLCAGGEFGFVLLGEAGLSAHIAQVVLTALVLSMLIAPFIVQYSERFITRFISSEWLLKSVQITQVAAHSMKTEKHAIICGFGRCGQLLGRFLAQEGVAYMALDLDPERVREAVSTGKSAVYADATRREALLAAGLQRASAVLISVNDTRSAEKILHHVRDCRPEIPVVARIQDERDLERLSRAGATEVVSEPLEASLMLASHALVLMGLPMHRVLRRIRDARGERYQLLRGFFQHGGEREDDDLQPRLYSVWISPGAAGAGRPLAELELEDFDCEIRAIRRRGSKHVPLTPETILRADDVIVLLGLPANLIAAEQRLLTGEEVPAAARDAGDAFP
ncbi:MAG: monovalent cation:proton antiporter-2 (CPA2) family protein [Zoogloeaceae bacterium]|jgi:CPA2 family monovalent cation:H+ antiporter-2|nr:monovalent cation:proton antiporter-2 (CPA2) family protein [Zoogloeaceae bacterium]